MTREAVMAYAHAQIGKPYVWAASGPDAFDCSGLTMMAYRAGGVEIPHYTVYQYQQLRQVPIGAALPGDLLFFGGYDPANGDPHHVGLYLSSGMMIDAPTEGVPVGIHNYNGYGDVMATVGVYPGPGNSPVPPYVTIGDDEMFVRFIGGGPKNNETAVYLYSGGFLLYQSSSQYKALGSPPVHPINVQGSTPENGKATLWYVPCVRGTLDLRNGSKVAK